MLYRSCPAVSLDPLVGILAFSVLLLTFRTSRFLSPWLRNKAGGSMTV
jgi:hypothetical protein